MGNDGESKIKAREKRITFLSTIIGIVLGGLLGTASDFFVEGHTAEIYLRPLMLATVFTVLIVLQQAEYVTGSTKKYYRIWCSIVLLCLVATFFVGWPARELKRKKDGASTKDSEQLAARVEASAVKQAQEAGRLQIQLKEVQREISEIHLQLNQVKSLDEIRQNTAEIRKQLDDMKRRKGP